MIVFRVDAHASLGNGHLMRCLTLAKALKKHGERCFFIGLASAAERFAWLRGEGFDSAVIDDACAEDAARDARETSAHIRALVENVDWLVVDVYRLDARWHRAVAPVVKHLAVIDDLCDRDYACDLLIDQNFGSVAEDYVARGVDVSCAYVGSDYALLREEFATLRQGVAAVREARCKAGEIHRVLISVGATDAMNLSQQVVAALADLPVQMTVVLAGNAPHLPALRQAFAELNNAALRVDVNDMAQLMCEHDIAVGASGATSWERCCLGLPAVTLVTAANQLKVAHAMAEADITDVLDVRLADAAQLHDFVRGRVLRLLHSPEQYNVRVKRVMAVCDGQGVHRVVGVIREISGLDS